MKILNISNDDTGGNSYFLSQSINKYTDHHSHAVKMMKSYLDYPTEIFQPSEREIRGLYDWADVIHIRNGWTWMPSGFEHKPVVITFSNVSYRKRPDHYTNLCLGYGWVVTVSTIDLVKWNDLPWLPNCRPDLTWMTTNKHPEFTVCQSPTKRERKGTPVVEEALTGLDGVQLDIIEQVSYSQCLERRARCHLSIDQFTHGYGNSAIEAWMMNIPVISYAGVSPWARTSILELTDNLPWYDTPLDADAIRGAVHKLKSDDSLYHHYVEAGREWAEEHHSENAVANRAIQIYEMALDGYA